LDDILVTGMMSTVVVETVELPTRAPSEAHALPVVGETRSVGSRVRQLLAVLVALVVVAGIGAMLIA
jgi:hypothetical protein